MTCPKDKYYQQTASKIFNTAKYLFIPMATNNLQIYRLKSELIIIMFISKIFTKISRQFTYLY